MMQQGGVQGRIVLDVYDPLGRCWSVGFDLDRVKIGSDAGCELRLETPQVDRVHATVEVQSEEVRLVDLGSRTGTYMNGQRVSQCSLRTGDRIDLGGYVLMVRRA